MWPRTALQGSIVMEPIGRRRLPPCFFGLAAHNENPKKPMIKRIFKWSLAAVAVLIVAAALLAAQTWYFKPLRFGWFLDRALLRHTLEIPNC